MKILSNIHLPLSCQRKWTPSAVGSPGSEANAVCASNRAGEGCENCVSNVEDTKSRFPLLLLFVRKVSGLLVIGRDTVQGCVKVSLYGSQSSAERRVLYYEKMC